jgi:hypothetical protein
VKRLSEVGGHAEIGRKANLGQVHWIEATLSDVRSQRRVTRPQMGVVPDARQVDGERRSPSPCPEYRDLANDCLL